MAVVIDSHQHFWDRSVEGFDYSWHESEAMGPLRRDFMPDDLRPLMKQSGVDYSVVVQTQHTVEENRWALGLADEHSFIAGVVGWVDLASRDCGGQVDEFTAHDKFVGVRHITQDEVDDNFIISEPIVRGLKVLEKNGVPFDLLFYTQHLPHALPLARKVPDLPMVIDHLSKPHIRERRMDDWLDNMKAAASAENICCKLSGMVTEADWKNWQPNDLKPYVQAALELFGPDRLMFGTDWPVCTLAGTYQQVVDALNDALGPISDAERDAIFGGTATRFYGLAV